MPFYFFFFVCSGRVATATCALYNWYRLTIYGFCVCVVRCHFALCTWMLPHQCDTSCDCQLEKFIMEAPDFCLWLLKKKITTCENKTALRKNITQMLVCFYCWESNTSTVYFFDLFNRSFVNRYYVCHLPHWWKLPEHRMCCNEEVSTDDFFTFVSNYICSIFQICFKYK